MARSKPRTTKLPDPRPVSHDQLAQLAEGRHGDPHSILGAHPHEGATTVRTLKPLAESVVVVAGDSRTELSHEAHGVWVGVLPTEQPPDYRLEVTYGDGVPHTVDDAYRYLPTLGEMDLHLINEGRHENLWKVLGAHVQRYEGAFSTVTGTAFAVWAPHAKAVRVKGDFNSWDGREHPMRQMGVSGVWELFVPDVGDGTRYKYDVLGADDVWRDKADPMATRTEEPPATSSVVHESDYAWGDEQWLAQRAEKHAADGPMSIYEVHLGSWRRGRSYRDLATELVDYVRDNGFTHVELLPVMEHPFGGSWGYQVTSYFAPTARFGDPDDLRFLIDSLHQAGIGVILDWVPAHFPKDTFALANFDGTPLYEDPNPLRGEHPEWGTLIFNFGRKEVRNFLVASALYWLEEFHADGLRVDAVASMLYLDYGRGEGQWQPNVYGGRENLEAVQFLQEMNATCQKRVPGVVTIAEESTSWPGVTRATHLGGLGFDLKWNMGWMHDTLNYLANEPVHRSYHHGEMTFSMVYAYSERYVLPLSHDEVVHGKGSLLRKMPGDRWQQLANLRAYFAFQWAHPGKQLLFMGCEFAQDAEWAEARELDWWLLDSPWHDGLRRLVRDLNAIYTSTPALHAKDDDPEGFRWIDANDASGNVLSFVRSDGQGSLVACVVNFAGVPHHDYRIGLPEAGTWTEVVNTDAETYAGSGVGNMGTVTAVEQESHGMPASASISVPPLGAIWLRYDGVG
ncbi:1,4-alpha-glucan branching protein GlgB [Nocardioides caldifontis]|uniref:1,4-alpha-glucan branching protein GlgB n=1 Tax=Nocardioides caldifontis TaxID=2588938 RepID=UPI0011E02073|nr:1,4-alpha-glucan branching protein GlgB [Nocardioides caldifontis]